MVAQGLTLKSCIYALRIPDHRGLNRVLHCVTFSFSMTQNTYQLYFNHNIQIAFDKVRVTRRKIHYMQVLGQNGSGQNGTDKLVWTKWYTDKMVWDKMVWTKFHGQNGT